MMRRRTWATTVALLSLAWAGVTTLSATRPREVASARDV